MNCYPVNETITLWLIFSRMKQILKRSGKSLNTIDSRISSLTIHTMLFTVFLSIEVKHFFLRNSISDFLLKGG